jgi:hypothetical protein
MKSVDQGGEIACSVDGRGPVLGEDFPARKTLNPPL